MATQRTLEPKRIKHKRELSFGQDGPQPAKGTPEKVTEIKESKAESAKKIY